MMRILALFACVVGLFWTGTAHAQDSVPIPASKHQIMNAPDQALRDQKIRQQELRASLTKVDTELATLRQNMIKVARMVKNREREMNDLEDKIAKIQKQRTQIQRKLQKDHRDIGQMISALIRLRDVPPEALLARPGAPIDTAEAGMVLKDMITPLQQHAAQLNADLTALAVLETDLMKRQADLTAASRKILVDQTKLGELLRRREQAYRALQDDLKVQDSDLKRLAQDAADFKDLVAKLEARNREIATTPNPRDILPEQRAARARTVDRPLPRGFGDVQMPISGVIRVGYGRPDDFGSRSEGMKIEGRAGALVVAPIDGIVRYRGYFKNYGNMIIIEHAKNYHSLVAGLAKIDTVVGQAVVAGEPLGQLGTTRAARPALYYELRQNGKPVNPAKIFADLG